MEYHISRGYLIEHRNHIFVYGDNLLRHGLGGAAIFRNEPNSYGFITKKKPSYDTSAYYTPIEYKSVFEEELQKLKNEIEKNQDKIYLITKLGAGLANKYHIWEEIIKKGILELKQYKNVKFLF